MSTLYRTFPEVAPVGPSGTAAPVDARTNGASGGRVRPRLFDVVADALDSARRDRGD